MRQNNLSHQRGAAIIVALFVMALVATCAAAMLFRVNVAIARTQLIINADEANLYAQGSIDWAIEQLKNDFINQKKNQVIDRLPIISQSDEVNGFTITSRIEDLQNKLNVNDLDDPKQQASLKRLLQLLLPKMDVAQIPPLLLAIRDWTSDKGRNGTLANDYQKQIYPYQAPHKPMVSISELRLVHGMTPEIFQALLPFVTALPVGTKMNVNNAEWPLLFSTAEHMSPEAAKTIQLRCKKMPFGSITDYLNFDIVKNNPPALPDTLDVNSSYFLVITNVKVAQQQITLLTVLERSLQNKDPDVKIVWQSKGTL